MFIVITMAYLIFWGPLFIVTLANYTDDWKAAKKSMAHEVARSFPLTLIYLRNLGVMANISVQKKLSDSGKRCGREPSCCFVQDLCLQNNITSWSDIFQFVKF